MAEDLRRLAQWVRTNQWPATACPVCHVGHLAVLGELDTVTSATSERAFQVHGYPLEFEGTFTGHLECAIQTCKAKVAVAGDYDVDVDVADDGSTKYVDFVRLRFATPALPLIVPPPTTPQSVAAAIISASSLVWLDPDSAANRLRFAIDEVLTAYGMRRFVIKNHKRRRLTTQERINEFRRYESSVAETLEAVKWIGNSGSHEKGLTATQVIEGAELFAHALNLLYDTSEEEIQRRIRAINKVKGPLKT